MITKLDEPTDPKFGKRPDERNFDEWLEYGIALMDKPPGPSSHEVSALVKKLLGVRKAGHSGTLDPNVSGVLPVAVNSATKALGWLLKKDKEYVGIMKLHKRVEEAKLLEIMRQFEGEISQTPPLRSAVARRERRRKVYYFTLLEYTPPDALFLVGCEAGTYVRKLCFDVGQKIGGANMVELRRTRVGSLKEEDAVTLQELSDALWLWREKNDLVELRRCVKSVESVLDLPQISLRDSAVEAICSGAALAIPGIAKLDEGISEGGTIALMSLKDELVAVARAEKSSEKIAAEEKGIAARPLRVIMKKGTYPKSW